ncbi:MAG: NAD(P)-dependent glycerol-3-phosphate dehydrogenase [Chloroflexi bacterium]|nr:NAD(P)-dependent glycerol-3-phosphate dehydrogenase [Chloroflexota bacterium]
MPKLNIIGTTSWGITLGSMLAHKGLEISIWARTEKEAQELNKKGPNPQHFPGFTPSKNLSFTGDLGKCFHDSKAVILAVPSQSVRENMRRIAKHLDKSIIVISGAKGLEVDTGKRMSQVVAEEMGKGLKSNICVLSGPNLAREILKNLPAASVVAAEDAGIARKAQKMLTCPNFCVFTHTDIVGLELGGALKNIIALGAGIADGMGYGDNAKAAFMTRGLTEITALGVALGANPLTFSGLAGLGDLIATCASPLSRNHYVGAELSKGRSLKEILESMDEVAEGVGTTLVARNLAQKLGLEMPITEKIYRILYENAEPRQIALELMGANNRHELTGRRWKLFSLFRRRRSAA